MARGQQPGASAIPKVRRQRASPSRLVKLYKYLTEPQKKKIRSIGFGGLLEIASRLLPAAMADWLMGDCFDVESSELVFPGRGRIAVNADSVCEALGLPKTGDGVSYTMETEAIEFISNKFGLNEGMAPTIDSILERLKRNNRADDDNFLRSWLMIAISTFLCPPTSMGISPRCYPSLVDLKKVKNLNWCQFVVDQLKDAAIKKDKKNSFRGCLLVLVILYADSLMATNVDIPSKTPRVAAWSYNLLEQVIKQDTRSDGSFGKLKLKESRFCTPQLSMFQLADITRFVDSKVHRSCTPQRKQELNNATIEFCSGFTGLLGTFIEKVSECEAPAAPAHEAAAAPAHEAAAAPAHEAPSESRAAQRVGRNKRARETVPGAGSSSLQRDGTQKRSKSDHAGTSRGQVQTRAMRRSDAGEDESLGADYEEDLLSESEEEDSDDEDEVHDSESDDGNDGANGIGNLPPVLEDDLEDEVQDDENQGQADEGKGAPADPPPAPIDPPTDPPTAEGDHAFAAPAGATIDADLEDDVTLDVRLQRIRDSKAKCNVKDTCIDPKPLEVIPPEHKVKPKSRFQLLRGKLKLPSHGETHGTERHPLAFTPPAFSLNLTQEFDPPGRRSGAAATASGEDEVATTPVGSDWSLSKATEEELAKAEADAVHTLQIKKGKAAFAAAAAPSSSMAAATGNASVTPAYVPHPRRIARRAAALRTPYINYDRRMSFHCSREVCDLYDLVCAYGTRRASRSQKAQSEVIVFFYSFYATLDHLAMSVKPCGKLMSPVAEVAICAIDDDSTNSKKRVLPLRVSSFLLQGELNKVEVKTCFRKAVNHLHRCHMVMFPVLQMLGDEVGHYFLLVLNLRNRRFEVLDSMRSLEDAALSS